MLKLAFIGFGTVGQGLAEILQSKATDLRARYGFEASVVAVSDSLKGAVYHPDGLDLNALLATVQQFGVLKDYPDAPGLVCGWDSLKTIRECNADVIVEVSWTNIKTGEPSISHIRAAFESGKHVVTTNKGPVALAYRELSTLAASKGLHFGFEGTVLSGTPVFSLVPTLAGCEISEVRGILNGTTNYILTQMEIGKTFAEALADAQRLGYAEANPEADVEGWDAKAKVIILANTLMGGNLTPDQILCKGISGLTLHDIESARARRQRWKLIGYVRRRGDEVEAAVAPMCLSMSDPLAAIEGATNALTFETDLLGGVTIVGPGAGKKETGFALLADLLAMSKR